MLFVFVNIRVPIRQKRYKLVMYCGGSKPLITALREVIARL